MKRQLTPEERRLTNQGIKRIQEEAKDLFLEADVLTKTLTFLKQKNYYDDFVRPYNRGKQYRELTNNGRLINMKISDAEKNIKAMKSHLREGVEVKKK